MVQNSQQSELNLHQRHLNSQELADFEEYEKNSQNSEERKKPVLVFDVYLGEEKGMRTLVVFEEDSPSAIAKQFKE